MTSILFLTCLINQKVRAKVSLYDFSPPEVYKNILQRKRAKTENYHCGPNMRYMTIKFLMTSKYHMSILTFIRVTITNYILYVLY